MKLWFKWKHCCKICGSQRSNNLILFPFTHWCSFPKGSVWLEPAKSTIERVGLSQLLINTRWSSRHEGLGCHAPMTWTNVDYSHQWVTVIYTVVAFIWRQFIHVIYDYRIYSHISHLTDSHSPAHSLTLDWLIDWLILSEWVSESVSQSVSQWVSQWVSESVSESVSQTVSQSVSQVSYFPDLEPVHVKKPGAAST